ncbi:MAG: radical SAM protein [Synergistaceae bacterium]|jgi:radical SAM protein with 4Fe4S-binding SPASM domain|nr:radical SAM protein [Synergistaceae bacterium]
MTNFKIIAQERVILKDLLPLKKPLSIFIEPSNMCNFRCCMCVHGSDNTRDDLKPFRHIDMELYRKIIQDLHDWEGPRLKTLRLAILGEPLINKDFPEMVAIAKDAEVSEKVDTFSNGSLLTPDLAGALVDSGLDYIRFSIYSVLDDRHRIVTQQDKYSPRDILKNITYLRKARDRRGSSTPYILVKMFDTYGPENDKFIEMYRDIADEIDFEKIHDATKYSGNDLVGAYYDDEGAIKRTHEEYKKNLHPHVACPRPFIALCVDSLGNVLMCTHDAPRYTKIANLNETSIKDVWFGDALFEFRRMQIEGRKDRNKLCRNCDWYKLFPIEDNVDGLAMDKIMPQNQ